MEVVGDSLALLAAAGLGSVFASLFDVAQGISARTYEREHDTSYLNSILRGVVAGFILAELVPLQDISGVDTLTQPLLALLGGFSAGTVHRILTQLVGALEAAFQADRDARIEGEVRNAVSAAQSSARDKASQVAALVAETEGMVTVPGAPTPPELLDRLRTIRRALES